MQASVYPPTGLAPLASFPLHVPEVPCQWCLCKSWSNLHYCLAVFVAPFFCIVLSYLGFVCLYSACKLWLWCFPSLLPFLCDIQSSPVRLFYNSPPFSLWAVIQDPIILEILSISFSSCHLPRSNSHRYLVISIKLFCFSSEPDTDLSLPLLSLHFSLLTYSSDLMFPL